MVTFERPHPYSSSYYIALIGVVCITSPWIWWGLRLLQKWCCQTSKAKSKANTVSAWLALGTLSLGVLNYHLRNLAPLKPQSWRDPVKNIHRAREGCLRSPSCSESQLFWVFPAQAPDMWQIHDMSQWAFWFQPLVFKLLPQADT